jgi:hypothetical protein
VKDSREKVHQFVNMLCRLNVKVMVADRVQRSLIFSERAAEWREGQGEAMSRLLVSALLKLTATQGTYKAVIVKLGLWYGIRYGVGFRRSALLCQ